MRDLAAGHDEVAVFGSDAELVAASQELFFRRPRRTRIVHADVVQVHTPLVLAVESPHVGPRAAGLQHDGDAVQLVVAGMKDVAAHRAGLDRRGEVPVEGRGQIGGDGLRRPPFDLVSVNEMHHFAILEQRH